jgi:acyl dehydratase
MTQAEEIVFDRSVLGVEVEVGKFEVTADHIRAFCEAVGETNPLFTDETAAKAGPYGGIVAPPVFYSAARVGQGPDPKVQFGNTAFAAGQHCEFFAPIRAGDTITARTGVAEVYEKTGRTGRMVFVVRRTTYTNQRGEKVAVVDHSIVHRNVER